MFFPPLLCGGGDLKVYWAYSSKLGVCKTGTRWRLHGLMIIFPHRDFSWDRLEPAGKEKKECFLVVKDAYKKNIFIFSWWFPLSSNIQRVNFYRFIFIMKSWVALRLHPQIKGNWIISLHLLGHGKAEGDTPCIVIFESWVESGRWSTTAGFPCCSAPVRTVPFPKLPSAPSVCSVHQPRIPARPSPFCLFCWNSLILGFVLFRFCK